MKPGPAPKPAAMKKLEGNPGGRAINDALIYGPANLQPPEHLDELAKKTWAALAETLDKSGVLTEVDIYVFAAFCQAYSRWVDAENLVRDMARLDKTGKGLLIRGERGRPVQNPAVRTAQSAMEVMIKAAQQFGITPASRTNINSDAGDDENPFQNLKRSNKN